jgi:hypothetical protein
MVNNSNNINKAKESLNSQQFHQYQQNKQSSKKMTMRYDVGNQGLGLVCIHIYIYKSSSGYF